MEQTAFATVETVLRLFTHDELATETYEHNRRPQRHHSPEHALALAILQDAVWVIREHKTIRFKDREIYNQALQWVKSHRGDYIFSFAGICELMGFEPDYVRRGILKKHPPALDKRNRSRL